MKIKSYKLGKKKFYMVYGYVGTDSQTGKNIMVTRKKFHTKNDALKEMESISKEFNKYGCLHHTRMETFEDIYHLWDKVYAQTVEESTLKKTESQFKNHILPFFGELRVNSIKMMQCQDFVLTLSEKLVSWRPVAKYANEVFKYALHLSVIKKNPMDNIIWPRNHRNSNNEKNNFLEENQLQAFIEALDNEKQIEAQKLADKKSVPHVWQKAEIFLRILAFSGMRKGELLALHWKDVDFNNNKITINCALKRGKKIRVYNGIPTPLYIGPTKTRNSMRTIPLDNKTMSLLAEWRKEQYNEYKDRNINTLNPNQLVFTSEGNGYLSPSKPRKWMKSIDDKYGIKFITVHGLRHTHATLLIENDANDEDVSARLGHYDSNITRRYYVHQTENGQNRAEEVWNKKIKF